MIPTGSHERFHLASGHSFSTAANWSDEGIIAFCDYKCLWEIQVSLIRPNSNFVAILNWKVDRLRRPLSFQSQVPYRSVPSCVAIHSNWIGLVQRSTGLKVGCLSLNVTAVEKKQRGGIFSRLTSRAS